jgi:hypothetical protein
MRETISAVPSKKKVSLKARIRACFCTIRTDRDHSTLQRVDAVDDAVIDKILSQRLEPRAGRRDLAKCRGRARMMGSSARSHYHGLRINFCTRQFSNSAT